MREDPGNRLSLGDDGYHPKPAEDRPASRSSCQCQAERSRELARGSGCHGHIVACPQRSRRQRACPKRTSRRPPRPGPGFGAARRSGSPPETRSRRPRESRPRACHPNWSCLQHPPQGASTDPGRWSRRARTCCRRDSPHRWYTRDGSRDGCRTRPIQATIA
jgi:hypothetical protein